MCGGFVCFYAGSERSGGDGRAWSHLAYNAGRLASYAALGAVAGTVGAGLDQVGRLADLNRVATVLAGSLVVLWGAVTLLHLAGVRTGRLALPTGLHTGLGSLLHRLRGKPPVARAFATGLLTTLLPCGWLYAFVATAGGTGSAMSGTLVMVSFWAGTVPMMAAVGLGARRLLIPLGKRLPALIAVAVVLIGLLSITGKFHPVAPSHFAERTVPHAPR
jgi:sulfite exporter TauE/SafE